ncbi:MAG TPA: TolC family protein [Candidatus Avibacteroides excrementipullorum]|jgi:outer membrane protein|nr:TolC family protein [Candidatus Avibacteroides excrementipullorum]
MMNPKRLILLALCTGACMSASAWNAGDLRTDSIPSGSADTWTLQRCIYHALEQNIDIKMDMINAESAGIDEKTAKAAFLPSLNASIGQRIVNNPFSDTNTIIDGDQITSSTAKTNYNGSYGIDASWIIYNGSKRINTLKQQQTARETAELTVEQSKNAIIENIIQLYIQILYANEAVNINRSTLEVSTEECRRGEELLNAGSISKADYAQLQAQVSNNKYLLVSSQSNLENYKLQLKQLIELNGNETFDVETPDINDSDILVPLPDKNEIYNSALALRPEIKAGQLDLQQSDLAISIAKADYIPTLSLSAGIGTNHTNGSDFTFAEQMKTNWNNSIGLTLSIPIFNNRQTKSNVQKAKLQKQNSMLQLTNQQKELYKTIEGLWLDAKNSQMQYEAAEDKVSSTQTSYDLVSEQFNLGMKNTVELLTEKSNLLNAQQEMLQSKYMSLMNIILLNFYKDGTITF